jgi:hypothetical protein
MSSPRGVPLLGDQEPRVCSLPPFDSGVSGRNAVTLAGVAGLELDPWQQLVLESGLRRRDGKWAAFEVALIVARQNGKGTVLEALELAALFLFPDVRLILHSAHEFKTAAEAFLRVRALIEDNPEFDSQVSRIRTAAGAEAVELKDGKRLRFVARSSGSGRGFTSDLVILDEAYKLGDQEMAALLPTLLAQDAVFAMPLPLVNSTAYLPAVTLLISKLPSASTLAPDTLSRPPAAPKSNSPPSSDSA